MQSPTQTNVLKFSSHVKLQKVSGILMTESFSKLYATPEELSQWVREGKITDVKTIIGIFWLEKILRVSGLPDDH
jgi:NADPH-dependent curcumin reductase CurA